MLLHSLNKLCIYKIYRYIHLFLYTRFYFNLLFCIFCACDGMTSLICSRYTFLYIIILWICFSDTCFQRLMKIFFCKTSRILVYIRKDVYSKLLIIHIGFIDFFAFKIPAVFNYYRKIY